MTLKKKRKEKETPKGPQLHGQGVVRAGHSHRRAGRVERDQLRARRPGGWTWGQGRGLGATAHRRGTRRRRGEGGASRADGRLWVTVDRGVWVPLPPGSPPAPQQSHRLPPHARFVPRSGEGKLQHSGDPEAQGQSPTPMTMPDTANGFLQKCTKSH